MDTTTTSLDPEEVRLTLRLPRDLADAAADRSDEDGRSRNRLIVDAVRAALHTQPGRDELEVLDGDGQPPAFRLVEASTGPLGTGLSGTGLSGCFVAEVEGYPLPRVQVLEFADPVASGGQYQMTLDDRFAIMAADYDELWRWGWFIANAMAVSQGAPSHGTVEGLANVVEAGWGVMAASGCSGHGYVVEAAFTLPYVGDGDQWSYELRDRFIALMAGFGCHEIVTKLEARGPMDMDRRHQVGFEYSEIEAYGPGGATPG